jgi:two-component system sensor histidine kinase BaeS
MPLKLSIAQKLFASHLGLTIVVLLATLALARWSFDRGFNDYHNALQEERLNLLAEALIGAYRTDGNTWTKLTQARFNQLQRSNRPEPRRPRATHSKKNDSKYSRKRRRRIPSTALHDADGQFIVGDQLNETDNELWSRVDVVVDGNTIGILYSDPKRRFETPPETRFRHQQWVSSAQTAIAMLLLAVAVSFLLTRQMNRPLSRVMHSIKQLSSGNYGGRLIDDTHRAPGCDELRQIMQDLDRLSATLEENSKSRRRWLADTAHELRTPLTVLVGDVAAMRDGIRPFNDSQLESLERSSKRLHMLVEDLHQLAVSDVGGLRYSFEPVDLRAITDKAAQSYRSWLPSPIAIDVAGLDALTLQADPNRLAQLLDNLLANSLSYTDSPGRVLVTLAREDGNAIVTIDDTPPGVDGNAYDMIFDPLYRLESSRNRRSAGAGLGLAICRNIVRAHHGSITATPSPLGGLRIRVQLPLDLPQADSTERAKQ